MILYKAPHLLDMRHSNFNTRCVPFVVGRLLEDGTLSSLVGFLLTIEVRRSVNIYELIEVSSAANDV